MQSRGAFYLRILAIVLLIALLAFGIFDFIDNRSFSGPIIGAACTLNPDQSKPDTDILLTSQYTTASAGAPFSFTITYPAATLTDHAYELWYQPPGLDLTGLKPLIENQAVFLSRTPVSVVDNVAAVTWHVPAEYPAGTYLIVPSAVSQTTGSLVQASPFAILVRSDISSLVTLVPGKFQTDLPFGKAADSAKSVLLVTYLQNPGDQAQTVEVSWKAYETSVFPGNTETYTRTVLVPAHTTGQEVSQSFDRSLFSLMQIDGQVTDGQVTTISRYTLLGQQNMYNLWTLLPVEHTSSLLSDTYTVKGCLDIPPVGNYPIQAGTLLPINLSGLGATTSANLGGTALRHTVSFTVQRSLFIPKDLTISASGNNETALTRITLGDSTHRIWIRLIAYWLGIFILIGILWLTRPRRSAYQQPLQ